jgi:hypothetical protein
MAVNFQGAGVPGATDYVFRNYHASVDIPAHVYVSVDAVNVLQGAANATWGLVDTVGVVVVASEGDPVVGVTMEVIKAGATGRVRCFGPIAPMLSDGVIAANAFVQASATALKVGYAKAAGSADASGGLALNTTAADGDTVLVMLGTAKNA